MAWIPPPVERGRHGSGWDRFKGTDRQRSPEAVRSPVEEEEHLSLPTGHASVYARDHCLRKAAHRSDGCLHDANLWPDSCVGSHAQKGFALLLSFERSCCLVRCASDRVGTIGPALFPAGWCQISSFVCLQSSASFLPSPLLCKNLFFYLLTLTIPTGSQNGEHVEKKDH